MREGTACEIPAGENYELKILTPELQEKWYGEISSAEEIEGLIFSAMEIIMPRTHNFPLALEKLPEYYLRKENRHTIKLAK